MLKGLLSGHRARLAGKAIVFLPELLRTGRNRLELLRGTHASVPLRCRTHGTTRPNVRCATIDDFEDLANQAGLRVLECVCPERR